MGFVNVMTSMEASGTGLALPARRAKLICAVAFFVPANVTIHPWSIATVMPSTFP